MRANYSKRSNMFYHIMRTYLYLANNETKFFLFQITLFVDLPQVYFVNPKKIGKGKIRREADLLQMTK